MKLHLDFETFSSVNLLKYGVHKYVEAPDFEITLCAYAVDDEPVRLLDLTVGGRALLWQTLYPLLADPRVLKVAHNASFEMACLRAYGYEVDTKDWQCTAVQASELGLPRSLGDVCKVLRFPEDKSKQAIGRALIRYFCIPCKPTKANGGRTRNLPEHAPERWESFKAYCIRDVEAEREIDDRLSSLPVPGSEWALWQLDQRINDRGALVDMDFVKKAVALGKQRSDALESEAMALTGLNNPNSVKQLKKWLETEMDEELETLRKDDIKALLKTTDDAMVDRVLRIRQELGKTSLKKYDALLGATCADDRLRGTLLFYGASRTGRWAGKIFQPQNLPQNHLKDLEGDRWMFKTQDLATLETLDYNVSDTLSQLIRTAIIPKDGCKFIVADFSAVEARNIAWYADEAWRLEVFRGKGKIYEASAAAAFHIPIETIVHDHENYRFRALGKVLELACFAEGTEVLTRRGLISIERLYCEDMVWDGVEWVHHGGVVCRGIKEVINYEGITATPDHPVWIEGEPEPVQLIGAASRGARLLRSGDRGEALRVGEDYKPGEAVEREDEPLPGAGAMSRVPENVLDYLQQPVTGPVRGVPVLLPTKDYTLSAGPEADRRQAAVHKSKRQRLQELWRARNNFRLPIRNGGGVVGNGKSGTPRDGDGTGSDRQQRELRSGESAVCDEAREQFQQALLGNVPLGSTGVAIRSNGSHSKIERGDDPRADTAGRATRGFGEAQELARDSRTARVYDILNCGPRNRFTANDVLVHNCGYGGSAGAVETMDRDGVIPESERKPMVQAWRKASPNIVKFWWKVGDAAMAAVENPNVFYAIGKGAGFIREKGFLFMRLPSGRRLAYPRPMIEEGRFGPQVTYEGMNQYTKKWGRIETYGPKLVENLVQATCRDLLARGMHQVEAAGYDIVLHVHDEAVLEVPMGVQVDEIEKLLATLPDWAAGMPHKAAGFETMFYKKD